MAALNPRDLIGETLGRYRLEQLVATTKKSWVFTGIHPTLGVKIGIKVLDPSVDEAKRRLFETEGTKLTKLTHPRIIRIYDAGREQNLSYIVCGWTEGETLADTKNLSLDRILSVTSEVLDALSYAHSQGVDHNDIKPGNIVIGEAASAIDFGDWSGRTTQDPDYTDLAAMASRVTRPTILKHHPQRKIPKRLERILKRAEDNGYKTAAEFREAIDGFRKWDMPTGIGLSRRGFIKTAAAVLVFGAPAAKMVLDRKNYNDSIWYAADALETASQTDEIEHRLNQIGERIGGEILERWGRIIREGKFVYATDDEGKQYNTTDGSYWSDGFLPGSFWRLHQLTGNQTFLDLANQFAEKLAERAGEDRVRRLDDSSLNSRRFFYSHALGFDVTKDQRLRTAALRAADSLTNQFANGEFLTMPTPKVPSDRTILIDAMQAIPLLCWAYEQTNDLEKYGLPAIKTCERVRTKNIREDGSVVQGVIFRDLKTFDVEDIVTLNGKDRSSCFSRGIANAVAGFSQAAKTFGKANLIETATTLADALRRSRMLDGTLPYEPSYRSTQDYRDSSATATAASAFLGLGEPYRTDALQMLRVLSTREYLAREKNEGILLHACANSSRGTNLDCSLIHGDYHFLEALKKIREN